MITKGDSIYEHKTKTSKMLVHETLHHYKINANDTISKHVAQVQNSAGQLNNTGDEISNAAITIKILGSLPAKYRNVRQA